MRSVTRNAISVNGWNSPENILIMPDYTRKLYKIIWKNIFSSENHSRKSSQKRRNKNFLSSIEIYRLDCRLGKSNQSLKQVCSFNMEIW